MLLCLPPLRIPVPFSEHDITGHMPGARIRNPHVDHSLTTRDKLADLLPFKLKRHLNQPKVSNELVEQSLQALQTWEQQGDSASLAHRQAIARVFESVWKRRATKLVLLETTLGRWSSSDVKELPPLPPFLETVLINIKSLEVPPGVKQCTSLRTLHLNCEKFVTKPEGLETLTELRGFLWSGKAGSLTEEDLRTLPEKCKLFIAAESFPDPQQRQRLKALLNTQSRINIFAQPRVTFTKSLPEMLENFVGLTEEAKQAWQEIAGEEGATEFNAYTGV